MFKKLKDFIAYVVFKKQIIKKELDRIDRAEVFIDTIETNKKIPKQVKSKIEECLKHFDFDLILQVHNFLYTNEKYSIKKVKDSCKEMLEECYLGSQEHKQSYFIETMRFKFRYDYDREDFSMEYILAESGKGY